MRFANAVAWRGLDLHESTSPCIEHAPGNTHNWRQDTHVWGSSNSRACKTRLPAHRRKERTVGKKAEKSSQKPHVSSANPGRTYKERQLEGS